MVLWLLDLGLSLLHGKYCIGSIRRLFEAQNLNGNIRETPLAIVKNLDVSMYTIVIRIKFKIQSKQYLFFL